MPRGDRSAHPHRAVSGSFRGTVGYRGVSADDAADPAVVFPPRPVTVPASATTPLTAGSDTIEAGGSLTVTDGTTDVAATSVAVPVVADDGGGQASILPGVSYDPESALLVFETGGPTVGIRWPNGTGGQPLFKLTGGSIDMQNATGYLEVIDPEAPSAGFYTQPSNSTSVTVGGNYGHRFLVLTDAGGVVVLIEADGSIKMPTLPTSDPAVAGQLWNNAGTLKVSAG